MFFILEYSLISVSGSFYSCLSIQLVKTFPEHLSKLAASRHHLGFKDESGQRRAKTVYAPHLFIIKIQGNRVFACLPICCHLSLYTDSKSKYNKSILLADIKLNLLSCRTKGKCKCNFTKYVLKHQR